MWYGSVYESWSCWNGKWLEYHIKINKSNSFIIYHQKSYNFPRRQHTQQHPTNIYHYPLSQNWAIDFLHFNLSKCLKHCNDNGSNSVETEQMIKNKKYQNKLVTTKIEYVIQAVPWLKNANGSIYTRMKMFCRCLWNLKGKQFNVGKKREQCLKERMDEKLIMFGFLFRALNMFECVTVFIAKQLSPTIWIVMVKANKTTLKKLTLLFPSAYRWQHAFQLYSRFFNSFCRCTKLTSFIRQSNDIISADIHIFTSINSNCCFLIYLKVFELIEGSGKASLGQNPQPSSHTSFPSFFFRH